jgi:hypothetical protein
LIVPHGNSPETSGNPTGGLDALPGWNHEGGSMANVFAFGSFREVFSFMTRVAFEATFVIPATVQFKPLWRRGIGWCALSPTRFQRLEDKPLHTVDRWTK